MCVAPGCRLGVFMRRCLCGRVEGLCAKVISMPPFHPGNHSGSPYDHWILRGYTGDLGPWPHIGCIRRPGALWLWGEGGSEGGGWGGWRGGGGGGRRGYGGGV